MLQQYDLRVDGYRLTKLIGQGQYGQVYYSYKETDPKTILAAKRIPCAIALKKKNYLQSIKQEIKLLSKVNNKYIVKLIHATRTSSNYYIFLEYCNQGDLEKLLKRKGQLSESEALTYFKQIVYGFKSIYQENIIHRDIKPSNILLHNGVAKIGDFGFARVVDDMEEPDKFTLLGTPLYCSPQILSGEKFNSKSDIWSLGVSLYQLLFGITPWHGDSPQQLLKNIMTKPLQFPQKKSNFVEHILRQMLEVEESNRISWYQLFEEDIIKLNSKRIKEKLHLIIDSVEDLLEQQRQINQVYINNNTILLQIDEGQLIKTEEDEIQQNIESDKQIYLHDTINIKEIEQLHEIERQQLQIILKIDQILRKKRDVALFLNQTTILLFNNYKQNIIKLNEDQFYQISVVIQKLELIYFDDLSKIMANKEKAGNGIIDLDWQLYRMSKQYFTTLNYIQTDKSYVKPYYENIVAKTLAYFNAKQNQKTIEIQQFIMVITQELILNNAFKQVYTSILVSIIKELYNQKVMQNDKFQFWLLFKYLIICLLLEFDFLVQEKQEKSWDYQKYIEHYQNIPITQLKNEVIHDYESIKKNKNYEL